MPAGLGTLFAGLLLIVLAFVEGSSVWKALHEVLFGLFGCGSFVLGAAICYLAILYTRGEDLIGQMFKLMLGLVFASGTVIVFSEIPADIPAARMVAECYQNGVHAWLGGGAIGALLGGNLLLLCGRPAANLVMVVLALCASLYIFDITPAELWQWMCELGGSAHALAGQVHVGQRLEQHHLAAIHGALAPQPLKLGLHRLDVPALGQVIQGFKAHVVAGAIVFLFRVAQPHNEPGVAAIGGLFLKQHSVDRPFIY